MVSTNNSGVPPSASDGTPPQPGESIDGKDEPGHEQQHHQQPSTDESILPLSDGTPHPDQKSNDGQGEQQQHRKQREQQSTVANESSFLTQVSETLPSHDDVQTFLSSPGCGAVSTFTGITRDNFAGKKVTRLSYEGYTPMAIKELRNLCRDAKVKYESVDRLAAVHILGDCPVGEASVIVGCSSPHRREAIRCTEYLIDELKGRVPIWKKEIYEGDEGSVWKENVEWREGRRRRVMVREEKDGGANDVKKNDDGVNAEV
eukprot:CAMPEP_0172572414 /NCGR_PEP_ID=MMETSP1067-20121228/135031_1 /TAXON_ID=265564 ORGANISM="Thalassiosira punctigera, Strain Tpunct2005C2" /NCGR_SAMPLE_ID=MMETSP1067 /ASSEMBLY_ACC=CAM_ASM_000444 /LENGTH=259 /DNA_ID=CAMNT_0013364951 /DNA_START=70 /DNA_END=849 /DNA_ORIENTATION=-